MTPRDRLFRSKRDPLPVASGVGTATRSQPDQRRLRGSRAGLSAPYAALVQCRPYGPDLRMKPAPSYATSDLWLPTPPIGGRHAGQGSPSTRPSEHTISWATCRSDRFVSLDDALRAVAECTHESCRHAPDQDVEAA